MSFPTSAAPRAAILVCLLMGFASTNGETPHEALPVHEMSQSLRRMVLTDQSTPVEPVLQFVSSPASGGSEALDGLGRDVRTDDTNKQGVGRTAGVDKANTATVCDIPCLNCSYSWDCAEAIGVVYGNWRCRWGESSGNPSAYHAGNYGLYQINSVHAARVDYALERLFDAATNIAVAHALWLERGWQPWACRP